jgi:hypothetical protein
MQATQKNSEICSSNQVSEAAIFFGTLPYKKKFLMSSRLDVVEIARVA